MVCVCVYYVPIIQTDGVRLMHSRLDCVSAKPNAKMAKCWCLCLVFVRHKICIFRSTKPTPTPTTTTIPQRTQGCGAMLRCCATRIFLPFCFAQTHSVCARSGNLSPSYCRSCLTSPPASLWRVMCARLQCMVSGIVRATRSEKPTKRRANGSRTQLLSPLPRRSARARACHHEVAMKKCTHARKHASTHAHTAY